MDKAGAGTVAVGQRWGGGRVAVARVGVVDVVDAESCPGHLLVVGLRVVVLCMYVPAGSVDDVGAVGAPWWICRVVVGIMECKSVLCFCAIFHIYRPCPST